MLTGDLSSKRWGSGEPEVKISACLVRGEISEGGEGGTKKI
jgi:hypothetical protein